MNPQLSLAKRLAAAYNYSYEANMNDYSQHSINSAQDRIEELRAERDAAGLVDADLVEWVPRFGHYRAVEATDHAKGSGA